MRLIKGDIGADPRRLIKNTLHHHSTLPYNWAQHSGSKHGIIEILNVNVAMLLGYEGLYREPRERA